MFLSKSAACRYYELPREDWRNQRLSGDLSTAGPSEASSYQHNWDKIRDFLQDRDQQTGFCKSAFMPAFTCLSQVEASLRSIPIRNRLPFSPAPSPTWLKSFILLKGGGKKKYNILESNNKSCVCFLFQGRLGLLMQQHEP